MLIFKPTADERETLRQAVEKFSHEPDRSSLLAHLDLPDSEFDHATAEWGKLKLSVEHQLLHAQTQVRRDPNKKSAKLLLAKIDALSRKFNPNFS